ncbi:MAG: extracellular solute-binding protein [Chloroflexi bacterium]|nr:extracellular solute-binding protein [Chloroflexota bacterium]MBI4331985.1 extracellular solute-binding protein [Chloroflexota bacterium]
MFRKMSLVIGLVAAVATLALACGRTAGPGAGPAGGAGWQEKWDKTLAAAKQEGSVRMYIIMTAPVREELSKGFKAKYGIDVEFVAAPPAEIAQRFVTERTAGQSLADVFNAGGTTLLTVIKPKGLLSPFTPELILPEVTDTKVWRDGKLPFVDKDGTVVGLISAYETYASRNTDLVKENEITTFKDLLDPKWKGKIVMNDPTIPGAGASFVAFLVRSWGEEDTKAYLKGLVGQDLVVTRDWRQQVEWVARGKYPIAIAPNPDNVTQFMAMSAPITPIRAKEGGVRQTVSAAIALPTNPPHPNARTIFVNWLLSKDGQTALAKGFRQPVARTDVSTEGINPIFFPQPGDKVLPEVEEHFTIQAKMFPAVREIMAPVIK